jgi:acyl carrier protein phosphodiesterase
MLEIKGLEELSQSLKGAQEALGNLDGDLATVRFDPEEPASIEAAILEMERVIDARVSGHADNSFVAPLVEAAKENFRQAILDKAAAARGAGDEA